MIKIADVSRITGISVEEIETYLKDAKKSYKTNLSGEIIIQSEINLVTLKSDMEQFYIKKKEQEEQQENEMNAEMAFRKAMPSILITSGFNFEGYKIMKYSGYISGDDVIQVPRGSEGLFSNPTNVGESLMKSLVDMRRQALTELKRAAYDLGCNAILGVDFDYLVLDPETANIKGGTLYQPYIFGVTANGTAVLIEKE